MNDNQIYHNYLNLAIRTLTELRDSPLKDLERTHRLLNELHKAIPLLRRTIVKLATKELEGIK